MDEAKITRGLSDNKHVFKELLLGIPEEMYLWKPNPEKWCLLEIVCHLYDEERDDFRARTKHILETPAKPLPPIDPEGWVTSRNYLQQNYAEKLNGFLYEREQSVHWLHTLSNPNWGNVYDHAIFGKITAKMFLANWLAHDYLHFRQITKLKYDYLKQLSNEDLDYAGEW